jgi:outer membrane protein OmpA-like peptidoglycan-associated protein
MRTTPLLISTLGAILMSVGVATAHAETGVFYNPSNAASSTGFTSGYELFRTIGCPGRELLGTPCPVPAPVVAAVAEPAPAPAYVAPPEPAPVYVAPPAPQKLVLDGVNFDFDKSVIRPEDFDNLDKDVATLKEWGDVNVEVAGHTDSIGTDEYNIGLSLRRANAVRNYLINKSVSADRLTVKGYGESQPVADNATAAGRFQNRRVELVPLQ